MKQPIVFSIFALLVLASSLSLISCQRKAMQTSSASVSTATTSVNQQIQSEKGAPMLVGKINRAGLQKEPFSTWFKEGYQNYTVDAATLQTVKDKMNATEVLVFMGTWCGDSKREVSHFYKILDNMGYSEKKLQIVAVDNHPDRYKQSPQHEEKGWNIEYVPTFIFLKDGKEVGRIVEAPQETLEKDLSKILSN